nr:alpha/beta hydrolase [Nocardiopsis sinuspersici]
MEPRRGTDELVHGTMVSWCVPGQGPPLVCVHGAGVSSKQTLPLVRALSGRMEAWAVDLPGFGESTAPDRDPTVTGLAEALLDWVRAQRLTEPCLLGVSMGAQVVVEAAVRAPDEVGSVVLAGPTVDPRLRSLPVLAARLMLDNFREGPSVVVSGVNDYRRAGALRALRSWLASRDHRIERVLPEVGRPALVLRGTKDPLCPGHWAEEVTRLLPRGRLVTVPGQPHALTAAAPGPVADLVHDFVREAVR